MDELKKMEIEIAEKTALSKKLNNELKKTEEKHLALIKKQIAFLEKEKQGAKVSYNRQSSAIKKRNEKKRKSRTHQLCIIGGEFEKTFRDLDAEKAIEFFSTIRKVFPEDIKTEEISEWFFWLHQQKVFQDWANLDPDPVP